VCGHAGAVPTLGNGGSASSACCSARYAVARDTPKVRIGSLTGSPSARSDRTRRAWAAVNPDGRPVCQPRSRTAAARSCFSSLS
jgi:hypothetical protein